MTLLKTLFLACAALWLTGCSVFPITSVKPGMSREEVVATMGPPTAAVPLQQGMRLQYSGQPGGQYAFMVDLDAAGRVASVRQVLTEKDFERIVPGQWTEADVLREFGRPALVGRVASWNGDILTYRWYGLQDMFYWVYLDGGRVVQKAHAGVEERPSMVVDTP
ncbi:MAG: hypothetical protein ACT6Q9_11750 [Polaromonas sp.]|uniref:hypothetical protein n=1 Tax=Polaromonas sp. TaxID=1869339 RepID=UPI004036F05A